MGVARAAAVGVAQFNQQAGGAHAPDRHHPAGRGGAHRGAGGCRQVHPRMQRAAARTEGGGDAGRTIQRHQQRGLRRGGRHQQQRDREQAPQVLVAGWNVPMELPPSHETTAPVM